MADADSIGEIDIEAVYLAAEQRCERLQAQVDALEDEIANVNDTVREIRHRMRQASQLGERRIRLERKLHDQIELLNRLRCEFAAAALAKPIVMNPLPKLKVSPHEPAVASMQIVAASRPVRNMRECGVYFLIEGEKIVYVGQSVEVTARVTSHMKDRNKVFDRAAYIPVPEERLDEVELFWIRALRPEFNRMGLQKACDTEVELTALAAVAEALLVGDEDSIPVFAEVATTEDE